MNRLLRLQTRSTKRFYQSWNYPKDVTPETPVFTVTPQNGFLPRVDPVKQLPPQFEKMNKLLDEMSLTLPNGEPGLLAKGKFGETVERELPLYNVDDITDQPLLMGLFRDYTYCASSYLLEPCDIMNRTKGSYGPGREVLPKNIAVPLQKISDKIGAKPFMEYAQSYALYNYQRKDPSRPLDYDNLELIRKFSGSKSEHGFINIHVAMVRHTPALVDAVLKVMDSCHARNHPEFIKNMESLIAVMTKINGVMEEMWGKSLPEDYGKFRAFIMGTKDQEEMFPKGVIYEGVDENPRFYRGESGANDSIIPVCDNLLELTGNMPNNPMTDILKDFRSYRPKDHGKFVEWVEHSAREIGVKNFCEQNPKSLSLYIQLLDQVRDFRNRHWSFAKEYIIKRSNHPKATGGSPMATWLPNQLSVVLDAINQSSDLIATKFSDHPDQKLIQTIKQRAGAQKRILDKDVEMFKKKFAGKNI
ncbi:hypothetical protein HDV02_002277 [Globomyces sp. JEL0801]|nr:hypothetical protein HDV02_002277 [Globomyces sp. JEL0801]